MPGSIFKVHGTRTVELKESKYENEDIFQDLIAKHPAILAGDQITPSNPRRWLFIGREVPIPDRQGGSGWWALDHLFIDQDGVPTLVEVKRSTDSRIRREVVSQMLDYASHATEYLSSKKIRELFEESAKASGCSLESELGILSGQEAKFWEVVEKNLRAGKVRLLFVADDIPPQLRRNIEFLNAQMKTTQVLGIEVHQFLDGDDTVLVPRLVGQSTQVQEAKERLFGIWDEDSFLPAVVKRSGDEAAEMCSKILRGFEGMGCRIWWGRGALYPSFIPVFDGRQNHEFVAVWPSDKTTLIEVQFKWFKAPFDSLEKRKEVQSRLQEIEGVRIPDDRLYKRPSFDWSVLRNPGSMEKFLGIFQDMVSEIKEHDSST